jgi:hypothetical protein
MNKFLLVKTVYIRWLLTLCAVTALCFNISKAADGRDFAGFYKLSNVIDMGEQTALTLTVQIFNYSDAPLSDAQVTVQRALWVIETPPADDDSSYGVLGSLTLDDRDYAFLSGDFTVSTEEYRSWQQGGSPDVQMTIMNDAGQQIARPVELLQMLIIVEDVL